MKRILAIIFIIILFTMAIAGCHVSTNTLDKGITIDFIQSWLCYYWDTVDWIEHLQKLKAQGYDTIVLQSSAEYINGKISSIDYTEDFNNSDNYDKDMEFNQILENLFYAAKIEDFGVIVGLGADEDWWNNFSFITDIRIERWAALDVFIAEGIYTKFYKEYSEQFLGWYWSFEMYTQNLNFENKWAKMLNLTISGLNEIDSSLPIMCSPYYSNYYGLNREQCLSIWSNFFSKCELRAIDIVAPQDGFGAGPEYFDEKTYNNVKMHLESCLQALREYRQSHFYVNVELFSENEGKNATEDRIKKQIELANNYGEKLLSFSYSHYFIDE